MSTDAQQSGCWPDGSSGTKTLYRVEVGPGLGDWQVARAPGRVQSLYPVADEVPVIPTEVAEGLVEALEPVAAEARRLEADGLLEVEARGDDPALTFPSDIDLSVADLKRAQSALHRYRQAMGGDDG